MEKIKKAVVCKHLVGKSTREAYPPNEGLYESKTKGGLYMCKKCRVAFDKSHEIPGETFVVTLEFKD